MLPSQVLLWSVPPNGHPQRIAVLPLSSTRGCPGAGGCGLHNVASNFHAWLPQHPCVRDSVLRAYGIPSSTHGRHGHSLVIWRYCNLFSLLFSHIYFFFVFHPGRKLFLVSPKFTRPISCACNFIHVICLQKELQSPWHLHLSHKKIN